MSTRTPQQAPNAQPSNQPSGAGEDVLGNSKMPSRPPRNFSDTVGRAIDGTLNKLYPERRDLRHSKAKAQLEAIKGRKDIEKRKEKDPAKDGDTKLSPEQRMNRDLQLKVMQKLPGLFKSNRVNDKRLEAPDYSFELSFARGEEDFANLEADLRSGLSKNKKQSEALELRKAQAVKDADGVIATTASKVQEIEGQVASAKIPLTEDQITYSIQKARLEYANEQRVEPEKEMLAAQQEFESLRDQNLDCSLKYVSARESLIAIQEQIEKGTYNTDEANALLQKATTEFELAEKLESDTRHESLLAEEKLRLAIEKFEKADSLVLSEERELNKLIASMDPEAVHAVDVLSENPFLSLQKQVSEYEGKLEEYDSVKDRLGTVEESYHQLSIEYVDAREQLATTAELVADGSLDKETADLLMQLATDKFELIEKQIEKQVEERRLLKEKLEALDEIKAELALVNRDMGLAFEDNLKVKLEFDALKASLDNAKLDHAQAEVNLKQINYTVVSFDMPNEVSNEQFVDILTKVQGLFEGNGNENAELLKTIKACKQCLEQGKVEALDENGSYVNLDEIKVITKGTEIKTSANGVDIDRNLTGLVGMALKHGCGGKLVVKNAKLANIRTESCSFSAIELTNVVSSNNSWSGLNLDPQGLRLTNVVSYMDRLYGNAPEATMEGVTFFGLNHDHLAYPQGSKKLSCVRDNIDVDTVNFGYERSWAPGDQDRQASPWKGKSVLSPTGLVRYVWPKKIKSCLTSLELTNEESKEPGKFYQGLQKMAIAAESDATVRRELSRFLANSIFHRDKLPPEVSKQLAKDMIRVHVRTQDGTACVFDAISKDLAFFKSITSDSQGNLELDVSTRVTDIRAKIKPLFNDADESMIVLSGENAQLLKGTYKFVAKPEGIAELAKIMGEFEKRFKKNVLEVVAEGEDAARVLKKRELEADTWLTNEVRSKSQFFRVENFNVVPETTEQKQEPAKVA